MALLAISVAPSGVDGTSVSRYVALALDVARADGRVKVEPGPMFTTLEGEIGDLFEVARAMHQALADAGAPRIGTVIKIDDRRDAESTVDSKMRSLQAKLHPSRP